MDEGFQLTGINLGIAQELVKQGARFLSVDCDWPGGCDVSRIVECGDWCVGIRDSETGLELCCEDHVFGYEFESSGLSDEELIRSRYRFVSLIEELVLNQSLNPCDHP